jgi:hypothetical protein
VKDCIARLVGEPNGELSKPSVDGGRRGGRSKMLLRDVGRAGGERRNGFVGSAKAEEEMEPRREGGMDSGRSATDIATGERRDPEDEVVVPGGMGKWRRERSSKEVNWESFFASSSSPSPSSSLSIALPRASKRFSSLALRSEWDVDVLLESLDVFPSPCESSEESLEDESLESDFPRETCGGMGMPSSGWMKLHLSLKMQPCFVS